MRCIKSQSFISLHSSSYSDLVDSRIITNFHTYIFISHLYINYDIFITISRTVNRHWKIWHKLIFAITVTFIHGKIIHAGNDYIFIVRIFIIDIKFTLIGVDISHGQQWQTANFRRIIADDCLAFVHGRPPAISKLIPRLSE